MQITHLSSKGQIVIPQPIREAKHWQPGLEFTITEINDGIFLTPKKPFKTTSIAEIVGCTNYKGKTRSLKEMEQAIKNEAKKHK